MPNVILNKIYQERDGHYCHALEVHDALELESIVESCIVQFERENFSIDEIVEFFNTIEIYCLDDKNENEIFSFNIENYIRAI